MAESKEVFTMKWENSKFFELKAKDGTGSEDIVIIRIEENGHITELWPSIADICTKYFAGRIKVAGDQMQS